MARLSEKLPKFMFVREAYNELKNVTWPKPKKVGVFTGLVVVVVIIVSYFVSFVDYGFVQGLSGARAWLGEPLETAQPQIQLNDGAQILDENGNEIEVTNILNQTELSDVDPSVDN